MEDAYTVLSPLSIPIYRILLPHRTEALVRKIIHPERFATLQTYVESTGLRIKSVGYDSEIGQLDLGIETPTYLSFIETQVEDIAEEAHDHGSLFIVSYGSLIRMRNHLDLRSTHDILMR